MRRNRLGRCALTIVVVALLFAAGVSLLDATTTETGLPASYASLVDVLESLGQHASDQMPTTVQGPLNPADCSQGNHTILVAPTNGDMHNTLLQDFDTLGQLGGGTLELGPGTYVINETLDFQHYSNVSIQGAGIGKTILTLPVDPVGNFTLDNGTPVGAAPDGETANFIEVSGGPTINNFEMCNLEVDAQANNATNDWVGSTIFDDSGGNHHVYSDIEEAGFFGPNTQPNGLHINGAPCGCHAATGYIIDDLTANNNTVPFEVYPGYTGGPNFLNVGNVVNCTVENVTGIGILALEVSPDPGCLMENWYVSGHMLIDPREGGSWGGALFQNITVNENGTNAPNALQVDVSNGTKPAGGSNFTAMRWNRDAFYGFVGNAVNMLDVENSTFYGGLNQVPAIFDGNKVVFTDMGPNKFSVPVLFQGTPVGGSSSMVGQNMFVFPNGTYQKDPFQLTASENRWSGDTIEIAGSTSGYLFKAPDVNLSEDSSINFLTYNSLGNDSPANLVLFDIVGSAGFADLGATVGELTHIYDDLPQFVPSTPDGLTAVSATTNSVGLSWNASAGPLTNYTVLVGENASALPLSFSAGVRTYYMVQNLLPGTEYYFAVEAWNASRNSGASPPVEATTNPVFAPSAPAGLTAVTCQVTSVGLQWLPSSGNVTNYTVFAATNGSATIRSFSVGLGTEFDVTGLAPHTEYSFAVEAWNGSVGSGESSSVNATTLDPPVVSGVEPISLRDWSVLLGTMACVFAGVFGPLLLVGYLRAARRSRGTGHPATVERPSAVRHAPPHLR